MDVTQTGIPVLFSTADGIDVKSDGAGYYGTWIDPDDGLERMTVRVLRAEDAVFSARRIRASVHLPKRIKEFLEACDRMNDAVQSGDDLGAALNEAIVLLKTVLDIIVLPDVQDAIANV